MKIRSFPMVPRNDIILLVREMELPFFSAEVTSHVIGIVPTSRNALGFSGLATRCRRCFSRKGFVTCRQWHVHVCNWTFSRNGLAPRKASSFTARMSGFRSRNVHASQHDASERGETSSATHFRNSFLFSVKIHANEVFILPSFLLSKGRK